MLDALPSSLVIAIIVAVLLLLIAIPVLVRRRRAGREEVLPPPELGQPIDYTSLPFEEPTSLSERFAQASPAVKLLVVLVPLVVIVGAVVFFLAFMQGGGSAGAPTPQLPLPTITEVSANLAGPAKILVEADTTLPDGTVISGTLLQEGADFPWYIAQRAGAQASGGRVRLTLEKLRDAPVPTRGQQYTVVLSAAYNGETIRSDPATLSIPSIYQAAFYQVAPTVGPTAEPTIPPTSAPSSASTPAPATPVPPAATPTVTLTATVFNGGNIREQPSLSGKVLGQINAGETVQLLERTADGAWYRVAAPGGTGWVSASLLTVDPQVAAQVPRPTPASSGLTATVFNGGNVRERPVTGRVLDQINAGETVQLLARTADGAWYQITDVRGVSGWVSKTLLTIDKDVANRVPVAR